MIRGEEWDGFKEEARSDALSSDLYGVSAYVVPNCFFLKGDTHDPSIHSGLAWLDSLAVRIRRRTSDCWPICVPSRSSDGPWGKHLQPYGSWRPCGFLLLALHSGCQRKRARCSKAGDAARQHSQRGIGRLRLRRNLVQFGCQLRQLGLCRRVRNVLNHPCVGVRSFRQMIRFTRTARFPGRFGHRIKPCPRRTVLFSSCVLCQT